MLSESHAGSRPGAGPWVQRALFAEGAGARLWGMVTGVAALLVAGLLLGVVASGSVVLLLLSPVALLSWYGGLWPGRVAAVIGALMQSALGGLWVPGAERGLDGVGFVLTAAVLLLLAQALPPLRRAAVAYREQSRQDPLTGLGNRRFFRDVATFELHRARRYKRPVSVASMDVDGFERVNQAGGYAAGDALLGHIGQVLTTGLRASDMVARIAGDEFAILLPETVGTGAHVVVGKLREAVQEALADTGHPLTVSVAIVSADEGVAAVEPLFRQVDELMQAAKREGPGQLRFDHYVPPPVSLV